MLKESQLWYSALECDAENEKEALGVPMPRAILISIKSGWGSMYVASLFFLNKGITDPDLNMPHPSVMDLRKIKAFDLKYVLF